MTKVQRKWSYYDDNKLWQLSQEGLSYEIISQRLQRTVPAIAYRLKKLRKEQAK